MPRSTLHLKIATHLALMLVSLSAVSADAPAPLPQQGYTTSTLREPLFNVAEVAVHTVKLNNWLNDNYASLDDARKKQMRERLYYLIDSQIKHSFAETGRVFPAENKLQLAILFSWAERLGVYGGNLVYNNLEPEGRKVMPSTLTLPPGLSLKLNGDLFQLESSAGWQVQFPYYFMIGEVGDFTAKNGMRTQMSMISTGAAKDTSKAGRSQATLLFVFSPGGELAAFESFWKSQIDIKSDDERVALGVRELTSQKNLDSALGLHREIVVWPTPRGACAVMYMGNEGTYQWNRPHFIDFVRAIQTN